MPRIAYIKINSRRRPPMFARECRVITKVLKMSLKLCPRFISLKRRRIRKERKMVMTPLISSEVFAEMKIDTKEPKMIIVSKMFHPSEK